MTTAHPAPGDHRRRCRPQPPAPQTAATMAGHNSRPFTPASPKIT